MARPGAKRKRGAEAPRHMSIRVAFQRYAHLRDGGRVQVRPLSGNFDVDGDHLTIGDDRYRLVKVPGNGDCAFDSMVYIVHAVINNKEWKGVDDAYESTGLGGPNELRRALDPYRGGVERDGEWGDQFDWVVFCAMFGVTVNIISYTVTSEGFGGETHSIIAPDALGARAFAPAFARVDPGGIGSGLHAHVCNHYNVHYDPMCLVSRG